MPSSRANEVFRLLTAQGFHRGASFDSVATAAFLPMPPGPGAPGTDPDFNVSIIFVGTGPIVQQCVRGDRPEHPGVRAIAQAIIIAFARKFTHRLATERN